MKAYLVTYNKGYTRTHPYEYAVIVNAVNRKAAVSGAQKMFDDEGTLVYVLRAVQFDEQPSPKYPTVKGDETK